VTNAIGIDLGGTKIAAGVVDESGRVHARDQLPSDVHDPDELVEQMRELIRRLGVSDADGVGIGAAGIIDHANGRYLYGPNTGLRDLDLAKTISKAVGMPASLDNDANCAAWGEHRYGVGRGKDHFLCITLGTGIGGGFVFAGRPYRGAHGGAAEVGHMLVDPDGPKCGCGRRGCWEQFASGMALERLATAELPAHPESSLRAAAGEGPVSGPMITTAARQGDAFAADLVVRIARWVGWGLASLVNIFEPERIAIAGGIAADWDLFADDAVRAMNDRAEAPTHRPMPDVVVAELGRDAGVVGAALLVLDPAYA
jgi:glucokinase